MVGGTGPVSPSAGLADRSSVLRANTQSCTFAAQHLVATRLDSLEGPFQADTGRRCFRFVLPAKARQLFQAQLQ